MSTSIQYSRAYAQLGSERVQEVNIERDDSAITATKKEKAKLRKQGIKSNTDTQYWATRTDESWAKLPGEFRTNRKAKTRQFFCAIPQILVNLEPANAFNPAEVWESELLSQLKQNQNNITAATSNKKMTSRDKQHAEIAATNAHKRYVAEVTLIRNSKNDLLSKVRKIKIPDARAILMIQILKQAYDEYKKTKDKRLLYETLWAIESMGDDALPTAKAPKPTDKNTVLQSDSSLVYDDYNEVEKLLKKARKVMAAESDMIKLQLIDMGDSLPPLGKFSFGFRLDEWQKRVLTWIDAGKSVVISAPTSSGKTVISSYVAIIFKSHIFRDGAVVEGRRRRGDDEANRATGAVDNNGGDVAGKDGEDPDEDGWEVDLSDDDDEEESEEEDENVGAESNNAVGSVDTLIENLVKDDKARRDQFRINKRELESTGREGPMQRVLFCVPSEPLIWQVAAYFTKLLREEGDRDTKVAIVTDQLTYYPPKKFDVMPQIVVGTPLALETALTKPRGLVGYWETVKRAQGDLLPGGFDHFDWVIYDEVHSLDGVEGAALQRLIRSMSCKFLALSATVGNAEELRSWMEKVKGDYIYGVEALTVTPEDTTNAPASTPTNTTGINEVNVIQTLSGESAVISGVGPETTILDLKKKICEVWPHIIDPEQQRLPHTKYPLQLLCGNVDLSREGCTLKDYDVFSNGSDVPTIHLRSQVHMLTHQGRFINLQRYVWDDSLGDKKLQTVSPLLAIDSVEHLRNGILENSSLSFTPKDSFRLWEEIKRIFPINQSGENLPTIIQNMDPYKFFGATERITLQRTKEYEDVIKSGLRVMAEQYPKETQELLYAFSIADPPSKEFDLCELVLELKARDMIPCLPFHLNTFEAIKLFQQLLAGIEWRQKRDHPTYHRDLQLEREARRKAVDAQKQATGKNDKALEEAIKQGDIDVDQSFEVDEYAPHPNYMFSKGMPLSEPEMTQLIDEMERNDGFEKRDKTAMDTMKGQNVGILKHALIRGLRRGIGLFIDEVSFPSYRRAVQRLASQGKLAVVISDDSLAFGVNMPFRTCVFCGAMFGELDELMAQQMSGRAGRRGLDTQGNLVYAGMIVSKIRRLMIGTISHITGRDHNPRYHTLFLQNILAPRHVGWNRAEIVGGQTLLEHIQGAEPPSESFCMQTSRRAMEQLNFITFDEHSGSYIPNPDRQCTYAMLSMIWQLRKREFESITLGLMFPDIMEELGESVKDFAISEKKQNAEKTDILVMKFFIIFCIMISRTKYESNASDMLDNSLHISENHDHPVGIALKFSDIQYFKQPAHRAVYDEWMSRFCDAQRSIPEEFASVLRDPVGPAVEIDWTFFQCILDRGYVHTLNDTMKQKMKQKIWEAGNVLLAMKNNCWVEDDYNRVSFFIFRTAFEKVKYLNSELIRGKIDFDDISASEREKRVEGKTIEKPHEALPWSDNNEKESLYILPNSWSSSIDRSIERCNINDVKESLIISTNSFTALTMSDLPLLQICTQLNNASTADNVVKNIKNVAQAVTNCTFANKDPKKSIGVLMWLCLVKAPQLGNDFIKILKAMYDEDEAVVPIEEEHIREWHTSTYEQLLPTIPSSFKPFSLPPEGALSRRNAANRILTTDIDVNDLLLSTSENPVSVADIARLKTTCEPFIAWLDQDDDDDEESDEED